MFLSFFEACYNYALPSVKVSFEPTNYAVTEGVDEFAELMLVRSGYSNRTVTITVTTLGGEAHGMPDASTIKF